MAPARTQENSGSPGAPQTGLREVPISIASPGSGRLTGLNVDRFTDIGFAAPALRLSQQPIFLRDEHPVEVSSARGTQIFGNRLSQALLTGSHYSR